MLFHYTGTLLEVLPKEKKQKDEKTVMLGQCTIDLIALLQGNHTMIKINYIIIHVYLQLLISDLEFHTRVTL